MSILVLAPHPDDEVLGCGGTIAKYAKAGEKVIVAVFSSGAGSHPLHKEHVIIKTRKEEAEEVHRTLGVKETIFFMLDDFNFKQELVDKEIILKLYDIVKKEKPTKIFMPALDDTHAHHRAVGRIALQMHSQYSLRCSLYTYSIWNPLSLLKRSQPRLVVDVSAEQQQKTQAYRLYKSQWVSLYQLVPIVTLKSFFAGLRYGCRWAEVFIQLK